MTPRCFLTLAALALLALTPAAVADTFQWNDDTASTANTWNRPSEDLSGLSGEVVTYSSLALFVDQSGEYTITSNQAFDGFLALYAGRFDPARPLDNLVAASDDSIAGTGFSAITIQMVAGVVYHVVTTGSAAGEAGLVLNQITGDGQPVPSSCFLGDEVYLSDDGDDSNALNLGRFCVFVDWRRANGQTGIGRLAGNRSEDSTTFYFFDPSNWEMLVKVLDGCSYNDHYWVFAAAATDVEYTLTVIDLETFESRSYFNELGKPADAVTDTSAFATCP